MTLHTCPATESLNIVATIDQRQTLHRNPWEMWSAQQQWILCNKLQGVQISWNLIIFDNIRTLATRNSSGKSSIGYLESNNTAILLNVGHRLLTTTNYRLSTRTNFKIHEACNENASYGFKKGTGSSKKVFPEHYTDIISGMRSPTPSVVRI